MQSLSSICSLPEVARTPVGAEVYRGLTGLPKTLSPWLFYDERGSELFEAITELPEYYLTRTERAIFTTYADEILDAAADRKRVKMIELGAGTATKTGLLLEAAVRRQETVDYLAIDVSESALAAAQQRIESEIPGVNVISRIGDYTEGIEEIPAAGQRRMALYIGSSIGNFEPSDAVQVLRELRRRLVPGDKLLLGADRVKERSVLLRAYDDAAGVTAAFNQNVLTRINRELGANFNLRLFRHRARWNHEHSRIEMHLESLIAQHVAIPALDLEIKFGRGETIHTENSYKFTASSISSIVERAGFAMTRCWTDEHEWFGVYLATAV
ncbi:dimethylhistidine N-methyltransferase [Silvibacterium bohemicum]|uniref:Dimethylhistidine N-methyltransferase n=1 Tax=Silvibacterium bohemicum TaxID=1577686 RepID=A0A841K527_9BACT|nr:L-histidine N(alpha)-methyltransferase [Silvibacterium bohemicum]MBB6147049.1 dimethylhistidine N-methyltransferase [Silvibacterium bohemicum]